MSFNLAAFIDHTLLKPTATASDIITLCQEAERYQFFGVCTSSKFVRLAAEELVDSKVRVVNVIGFPHGNQAKKVKQSEAEYCLSEGADELDMVMDLGALKSGDVESVVRDIKTLKEICGNNILKVILEIGYLSPDEILLASTLALDGGADYIKTSTGFGPGGATFEAVKIMKEVAGNAMKVKASGGIRDAATATRYIALGVNRIGTSSGVSMVQEP